MLYPFILAYYRQTLSASHKTQQVPSSLDAKSIPRNRSRETDHQFPGRFLIVFPQKPSDTPFPYANFVAATGST
jgi:hypothetical protein